MSFTHIMVHLVWATKNRMPLIEYKLREKLLTHIKENSIKQNIFIDTLNCLPDHIHILISLGNEQKVSDVVRLIKGESSHWANTSEGNINFAWQNDYYAMSVSESQVDKVRHYIKIQEEHHRKKSFSEECAEIIEKYKFPKLN